MNKVLVSKSCTWCGQDNGIEVSAEGYEAWTNGMYVQNAFPELNADERETLVSGTHPACWGEMFGNPDEDTDDLWDIDGEEE